MATVEMRKTMADLIEDYIATRFDRLADGDGASNRLLFALEKTGPVLGRTPPRMGVPLPGMDGGPPEMSVFRYETRPMGYGNTPLIAWAPMPVPEGCPLAADVPAPG